MMLANSPYSDSDESISSGSSGVSGVSKKTFNFIDFAK